MKDRWDDNAYCALNYKKEIVDLYFNTDRKWNWYYVHSLAHLTCARCVVRVDCLEFAQRTQQVAADRHGMWGGLSVEQRELLSKLPTGKTCTCNTRMACYVHTEPVIVRIKLQVENRLEKLRRDGTRTNSNESTQGCSA